MEARSSGSLQFAAKHTETATWECKMCSGRNVDGDFGADVGGTFEVKFILGTNRCLRHFSKISQRTDTGPPIPTKQSLDLELKRV